MNYLPFDYTEINCLAGHYQPSPVKYGNNQSFWYWQRSLFQRACSILDFTLPDDWQGAVKDFFLFCLFRFGYVICFEPAELGFVFQPGNISGRDFYYQPVDVTISNHVMQDKGIQANWTIGEDCELIKLTPDYMGIWDIIEYYADRLATLDNAINMALINSKLAYILGAKNKSAAEALKKALDLVNQGNPAVVVDKKLIKTNPADNEEPWQFIDFEVKKNYILTDLLQDFQSIKNDFDAEVGIPTLPYQKKERMITSESTMRSIDGRSRSEVWYDTLTSSIKIVNEHFNKDIAVKLRYDIVEEVQAIGETDPDRLI